MSGRAVAPLRHIFHQGQPEQTSSAHPGARSSAAPVRRIIPTDASSGDRRLAQPADVYYASAAAAAAAAASPPGMPSRAGGYDLMSAQRVYGHMPQAVQADPSAASRRADTMRVHLSMAAAAARPAGSVSSSSAAAAAAAKSDQKEESSGDTPDDEQLCVVCLSNEKSHAFVPCGHRCVCKSCALGVLHAGASAASAAPHSPPSCPVCRCTISGALHIFT
eukprot:TRINITY_DN11441_c0_g1_i2.p1 TRINITY_DN11441_c0_g1~~TRINITY_DN11441_c0_g1_i2.p1  ORF type:complete len:220 (-),score=41.01 TRINITY_DN11441_c0_g1_i2:457-1116(-)